MYALCTQMSCVIVLCTYCDNHKKLLGKQMADVKAAVI